MINIAPLSSRITVSAARQLSELDPALDRMTTMAERSDYLGAGALAQELWEQHIYDVRTLGFYLFAVFLEQGLPALPHIITSIQTSITTNWQHLGPSTNLQRHLDGALRWLFMTILGQLRFRQRSKSEPWQQLLKDWGQAPQKQILQSTSELATSLQQVVEAPLCRGHLFSLGAFLRGLPTTGHDDSKDVEDSHMDEQSTPDPVANGPAQAVAEPTAAARIELPLSPPLQLLLRKLAAFNKLVKLGKFRQAMIVHRDVTQSLTKFDPRVYLPSLLGEYFCNIVTYSQSLTQNLSADDGFTSRALEDLYHLDLDLFIAAKS